MSASFTALPTAGASRSIVRIAAALGEIAVPCCARELAGRDAARRTWARALLRAIADDHADRVRRAARVVADTAGDDEAKVDALALLAELGDMGSARFDDPGAMQERSARQLAGHLTTPDRVASAASLVIDELPPEAIVELVETMAGTAPDAAHRLAGELTGRVEVAPEVRSAVRRALPPRPAAPIPPARRTARPALLVVAVDPGGRAVVTIGRRAPGGRRWRGWSVLISEDGLLDDVWYDDDADAQRITDDVIAPLLAQGFTAVAESPPQARQRIANAARRAVERGRGLPPGYYLGRDLLALGDEHVRGRPVPDEVATSLDRAVGLFAAGDLARARALLERCATLAPDDPLVASNLGLVLAALGDPAGARPWLERAARREPAWALHHWNLAAILHRLGDARGCHTALRGFLTCPTARDPDRIAHARALCAEFARQRRLAPRRTRRRS